MKITSRQPTGRQPTAIEVRDIKVDADVQYSHNMTTRITMSKQFFIELVIRIPLSDADTSDINALGERMKKLRQAELLEKP